MKILVTGGTGFLGRHLVSALLDRGHRVYVMGRNFVSVQDFLTDGAIPIKCDLRDHEAVYAACAGMNTVYHLGALVGPWGDGTDFAAVNIEGTAAVLEGCRRHHVKRCVYVSSTCVTFNGHDQHAISEQTPYTRHFTSDYALTKKRAEEMVKSTVDVPAVIIRPSFVFGPGDQWLPGVVEAAAQQRFYQIGNGRNQVDLTYVDNVTQALLAALYVVNATGKTYIITNDEHVYIWDMIRTLLQRVKCSTELRYVPLPFARAVASFRERQAERGKGMAPILTRYGVDMLSCTQTYDITAARRDLGYQPIVSVAEGIERTVETWQLQHRIAI
ncbi:NAD-dependent epimerase/dehydratase family protein [Dictyobacter arantiisoli]|uniref:3-beta hydroxysteroid dehydrogenase n=1 Tax=Dictyobacter arantiisoli TaxID=2014874 RepID=A0A5A5TJ68_9CHLR|nr:NAD-dependent epimerase/dehydratase family protein [Dictyobacter arantiisoli]GCF11382.1 3-beta hydroxysteroid dehydrogenase [Dictyobacter arantiisoli]